MEYQIEVGQQYEINSFSLGFINILAIDLLVTIVEIDKQRDHVKLKPALPPGANPSTSFKSISDWFQNEYPKYPPATLLTNNWSAFSLLVDQKIAVLRTPSQ